MVSAQKQMKERLAQCDVVLEVRDARAPLSSANPHLETMLARKRRIIVLNKCDLISSADQSAVQRWFAHHQLPIILTQSNSSGAQASKKSGNEIAQLVNRMKAMAPKREFKTTPLLVLIAGVPNCGKSTLINALRVRHMPLNKAAAAAKTGAKAGVTRQVAAFAISEDPPIRVFDSPGIFLPSFDESDEDARRAFSLAVTGCVSDERLDPVMIADFILYQLNHVVRDGANAYMQFCGLTNPTDDVYEMLEACATRYGVPHDTSRTENAARLVIRAYRSGRLGLFCLDALNLSPATVAMPSSSPSEDGKDAHPSTQAQEIN
jgi:ribosome biogenesis GTPase A